MSEGVINLKSIKKTIITTMALGIGFVIFQPNIAHAEVPTKAIYETINIQGNQSALKLPSVSSIETHIEKSSNTKDNRITWNVETKEDFFALLDKAYLELPSKITLISSISKKVMNEWESEYDEQTIPSRINNLHTLASYSIKKSSSKVITITDKSNNKYTAKQIEEGIKSFSKEFAKSINHLDNEQKIKVIYDYIYAQYKYEATSISGMMVGNAYNNKLACNGFSRLFYELATASGVNVKLVEADDHFYNHVETSKGQWVIIDLTTDILLKKKHGATGLSLENYLSYVSKVGFYWAKPVEREQAIATPMTPEDKEQFLSVSIPKISY